ncbi:MAG: B12-binding domain-containing radical SAM protein [Saprospiraceae bacterium]|nr:B12-binding domain-containing radical SAM protein [Saprospiraceae bacterium]
MPNSDLSAAGTTLLFSPSFFYRFDQKQWKDQKPYPPYGTIYAASLMQQEGFSVNLFDTHLKESTSEIEPVLKSLRPRYLIIYDDGFNYLTKMCLTAMRAAAFELINYGKSGECRIIVCNSDAADHYDLYLKQGADFVILGEGELTLLELLKSLEANEKSQAHVAGLAFRLDEVSICTLPRPVLKDLDALPDPAWDLIDMPAYQSLWQASEGYFSLNLATTRGCPYKCNWCAKPIYGNRYNSRSPQRVVGEMSTLHARYGVSHFWMADDIFGLNPKWVQQFQQEILSSDLQIKIKIQSRADLLVQENYIKSLVEAGIKEVWIGAESGSQKVLDAMDKGTTIQQIEQSTRLLQAYKVRVGFFLQFAYPGESMVEIKETISMMLRLMPDDIGISISYPLPGTLFYERVKHQLRSKQNWVDSDDLDTMYIAAYSPAFYKQLHRFVHKLFRLKQGWLNLGAVIRGKRRITRAALKSIASLIYYLPAVTADRFKLYRLSTP